MLKKILGYFTLSLLALFGLSWQNSGAAQPSGKNTEGQTVTRERMVVVSGNVTMDLDLGRLNGSPAAEEAKRDSVRFEVDSNSFFTLLVFGGSLRDPQPGSMGLIGGPAAIFPEPLNSSANQLAVEKLPSDEHFGLVLRDEITGFVFFNIEGHLYEYDAVGKLFSVNGGRLLISEEFANRLGRPADAGAVVGEISIAATVQPIEITTFVNGAVKSAVMPPRDARTPNTPQGGNVPGPDIIVGTMSGLQQFGSSGTQVGLATGATSCNNGSVPYHFYLLPNPDHSVVSQNFYRMSGGASNNERFEQLGYAWNKHTFGAAQENACGFGCTPFPGQPEDSELGVGCSDPYSASQNAAQGNTAFGALGSRAWINPFTGFFPVSPRPENHTGHTHTGTSHRIAVERNDLNPAMNPGATYYLEVQYDSPHEYAWCQTHPGECNMYNNASYRRYNVSGTTSFTFAAVGSAVRMVPATDAWRLATAGDPPESRVVIATVEPVPGEDGRAFVAYRVTNPSAGVWHYEYAIHNQNLDRSIQSFSVPLGNGITLTNVGFRAPPNHPGFPNDGTVGSAGFSSAAWTSNQTSDALSWNTETFAQNPNANAIRFGTLYNFRFDSNRPPQATNATIGFFKTGTPITVGIQGPSPDGDVSPTPTPGATATPSATPGATATPSATATPGPGTAQAVNLSTRMFVQTGDNVGIGGFIVTGTGPKNVLLRAIGPSLAGSVPNALANPVLELHGPSGFLTIFNNDWRETQEAEIQATGLAPTNDLESAIVASLNPGTYTGIVRGNENGTGVALIEVYDLDPAAASKLANISTRAFVQTGDDIVIAGFILGGGAGVDNVVVRGLGPSLTAAGVPTVLANPTLELRDDNGTLLISNDDWQDNPVQAAVISAVGLAPTNDLESAVAATLPPGPYTALLSGVGSGTGNGLVEVYDLGAGTPFPTPTPGISPTPSPVPSATPGASPTPTPTPPPASPTPTPPAGNCTENFDGGSSLPAGWVATNDQGPPPLWAISTVNPDTPPNDAFVSDTSVISDKRLDTRPIVIGVGPAQLSFRNFYDFEYDPPPAEVFWDGGVLEVSINGGPFLDIIDPAIGGSFVSGGYNGVIDDSANNPIAAQEAWGANTAGAYINSVVNLGPNVVGQTIVLRFRMGTDEAIGAPGWRIDTFVLTGGSCP
ncbi:MAG TPA: hypothetical protein VNP98_17890 [Chthoniobacterales bacterium]|nr:hypothetical protein [Chthoniobacterales bacterium]